MPAIILNATQVRRGVGAIVGSDVVRFRKQVMLETAKHWHENIFPRHFGNGNKTAYGMSQRNERYVKNIKIRRGVGQGKYLYEMLTGQSVRWSKSMYRITGTSRGATVRATVPQYFTNPFIGSFVTPKGKTKTITRQPNKPDEVTRFNDRDRTELQQFAATRFQSLIATAILRTTVTTIG